MKLKLSDWASIAEIIGAIAIVVTLIYLAGQTRQLATQTQLNTQALDAQLESNKVMSRAAIYDLALRAQDYRMNSPRIYVNLRSEETLSPEEEGELDGYISALFVAREFVWLQYQSGSLDQVTFDTMMADVAYLSIPRVRDWWNERAEAVFEPDFIEYVNALSQQ